MWYIYCGIYYGVWPFQMSEVVWVSTGWASDTFKCRRLCRWAWGGRLTLSNVGGCVVERGAGVWHFQMSEVVWVSTGRASDTFKCRRLCGWARGLDSSLSVLFTNCHWDAEVAVVNSLIQFLNLITSCKPPLALNPCVIMILALVLSWHYTTINLIAGRKFLLEKLGRNYLTVLEKNRQYWLYAFWGSKLHCVQPRCLCISW